MGLDTAGVPVTVDIALRRVAVDDVEGPDVARRLTPALEMNRIAVGELPELVGDVEVTRNDEL